MPGRIITVTTDDIELRPAIQKTICGVLQEPSWQDAVAQLEPIKCEPTEVRPTRRILNVLPRRSTPELKCVDTTNGNGSGVVLSLNTTPLVTPKPRSIRSRIL